MPAYSTNPSTIRARRRKMNLTGEKRVEEAARTADYKAMLYARKTVQSKQSWARASDSEKAIMLEETMRDTMEKRRLRGQDTMSKVAAYRAGVYRDRNGVLTGAPPQPRVPISAFLQDNGFVPSRPGRAPQHAATAGPSNPGLLTAPVADMEGVDSAFAGANGIKSPSTPAPFVNMSPEPMLASIEEDVPMADNHEPLARLQMEMIHLRTICQNAQNAVASNNNIRDLDLSNVQAEMRIEKNRTHDLEARVRQLEGVVHALQNTSLGNIVERVNELESAVEDLKGKVGDGCDAEVAKMREVMGGLKSAIDNVGGF